MESGGRRAPSDGAVCQMKVGVANWLAKRCRRSLKAVPFKRGRTRRRSLMMRSCWRIRARIRALTGFHWNDLARYCGNTLLKQITSAVMKQFHISLESLGRVDDLGHSSLLHYSGLELPLCRAAAAQSLRCHGNLSK